MKRYYAWVGQNATTGTPHPLTGNLSYYGIDIVFNDKKLRDKFVADYRGDEICVSCSKRFLRSKNHGCSVRLWEEFLNWQECNQPIYSNTNDTWTY